MESEFLACLTRRDGQLYIEDCALTELARRYGTPLFVYSRSHMEQAFRALSDAIAPRPHLICYAVKANSNIAILSLFAELGAGFDIVSGGELARVLHAGGDPKKIVFSGVGKTEAEMRQALRTSILCFNVESENELERLQHVAASMGVTAPVSLRVNPDVDPKTHPYISTGLMNNKFGIPFERAIAVYDRARSLPNIAISGIDCHIGSQIVEAQPYTDAVVRIVTMVEALQQRGITLAHIDLGGGIGIRYCDETPLTPRQYAEAVLSKLASLEHHLIFEPGRYLVGNAGVLLTRIEYLKQGTQKRFAVVDAAMNDLIRPALYDAYQRVVAVTPSAVPEAIYDVVGPVCESGDFLAQERALAVEEGDLLAVLSAGAYGASMSSNYNTRPRAAEVLVAGTQAHLIRKRESIESLYALESIPPST